eukprot:XP_012810436.1 PREDICTED: TIR domain-containing adapter molecule 1-like isoform X1 [Xenopus tropicalis]
MGEEGIGTVIPDCDLCYEKLRCWAEQISRRAMSSCSQQHFCDLEKICLILSGIPLNELILCRHRLEHRRPSTDIHKILCALILLAQDKRPEALKILSLLPHCHMAQHIIQALIAGETLLKNGVLSLPPSQDAEILHKAGEIHALIEQENLCGSEVIKSNKTDTDYSDDDAPHTLVSVNGIQIPHIKNSPASMSLVSNSLQISHSPSVPSTRNESTERVHSIPLSANQEPHVTFSNLAPGPLPVYSVTGYSSISTNKQRKPEPVVFKTSIKSEIECSERQKPLYEAHPRNLNCDSNSVPSLKNNFFYPIPPQCCTYTVPDDSLFFNFVVLHVREDSEVARRVCDVLQSLGAGNGTTFCEGFEIPGSNPLTCIQEAVENSAYIILLMTEHFETRWAEFQSNAVLMNSINDENRTGCVIPFLPETNRLPIKKMPLALKSLIPLDELSPVFRRAVCNTFKQEKILSQKQHWERQQQKKKERQRMLELQRSEQANDSGQYLMHMCANEGNVNLSAQYMYQHPIPYAPVIHINNAENIQIGNHNCITVKEVAETCADDGNKRQAE